MHRRGAEVPVCEAVEAYSLEPRFRGASRHYSGTIPELRDHLRETGFWRPQQAVNLRWNANLPSALQKTSGQF
jgi:hypothetical protein